MSSTTAFTRRGFLTASAGAARRDRPVPAAGRLRQQRGQGRGEHQAGIQAVLPTFKPLTGGVTPDIPSVPGANGAIDQPGVPEVPDQPGQDRDRPGRLRRHLQRASPRRGTRSRRPTTPTTRPSTRRWARRSTPQPANGNTYNTVIPPLIAANKLPDWLHDPGLAQPHVQHRRPGRHQARGPDALPRGRRDPASTRTWPRSPPAAGRAGSGTTGSTASRRYTDGMGVAGAIFYRKDLLDAEGHHPERQDARTTSWRWARRSTTPAAASGPSTTARCTCTRSSRCRSGGTGPGQRQGEERQRAPAACWRCLDFCNKLAKAGLVHPDALAGRQHHQPQPLPGRQGPHRGRRPGRVERRRRPDRPSRRTRDTGVGVLPAVLLRRLDARPSAWAAPPAGSAT